ncbi:hypothetical protein [Herminiimonas fonticola]
MVKSIVEAHGGTVKASSQNGWNKFQINLPVIHAAK